MKQEKELDLRIEYMDPRELKADERNAKEHTKEQLRQIRKSIEDFGFSDPIGIGEDKVIIEGHGRQIAAIEMGLEKVPVIRLDHLNDEERVAYMYAHNQLTMTTGFDLAKMEDVFKSIKDLCMEDYGFGKFEINQEKGKTFFEMTKEERDEIGEETEEYKDLLERMEVKRTTDDCYTPERIYKVVADWVEKEYKIDKECFVRPFYPGGDYKAHKYEPGEAVVDNPPFSIMAEIVDYYLEKTIPFFLFAPGLLTFSTTSDKKMTAICADGQITYENGVTVRTGFVTNMEKEEIRARTAPDLTKSINDMNKQILKENKTEIPKYEYPEEVVTSAMLNKYSKYGIDYRVKRSESVFIRAMDEQKENGCAIFGGGYLLSKNSAAEKAAAEKAAAEKAAARKWKLSEREKEIVGRL